MIFLTGLMLGFGMAWFYRMGVVDQYWLTLTKFLDKRDNRIINSLKHNGDHKK